VPDVLIYADTVRSPELRHEVPILIPDPILYAEHDGARHAVVASMELPRVSELAGLEAHPLEELGYDELLAQGLDRPQLILELAFRACSAFGIEDAGVPASFPLELADHLRAQGIRVQVDRDLFEQRRRVKNEHELAGIRRAQRAAEAGMEAARELLRRGEPDGDGVVLDGEPLTSERIKQAIEAAFMANDATADEFIVSHGAQSAIGHHMGEGPIAPGEPVVIDLFPRDRESACYADMTRTFVVGEPPAELREWHALCKEALDRAIADVKAGTAARELFDGTCELFERHGHPTQRTKEQGVVLADGFFHGLGHGVGLDVHEEPGLGVTASKQLVTGDVLAIEPGLYRSGFGGVRLEDLLLVTDDGAENLTSFPYELEP
jgi:Xaa-Pro aminopeptidase